MSYPYFASLQFLETTVSHPYLIFHPHNSLFPAMHYQQINLPKAQANHYIPSPQQPQWLPIASLIYSLLGH